MRQATLSNSARDDAAGRAADQVSSGSPPPPPFSSGGRTFFLSVLGPNSTFWRGSQAAFWNALDENSCSTSPLHSLVSISSSSLWRVGFLPGRAVEQYENT